MTVRCEHKRKCTGLLNNTAVFFKELKSVNCYALNIYVSLAFQSSKDVVILRALYKSKEDL